MRDLLPSAFVVQLQTMRNFVNGRSFARRAHVSHVSFRDVNEEEGFVSFRDDLQTFYLGKFGILKGRGDCALARLRGTFRRDVRPFE